MNHARRATRRSRRRFLFPRLLVVATMLAGFAMSPARADPVVCVTVYYRTFGGSRQYIANNVCQGPSWWGPAFSSGPACVGLKPDIVDVCYTVVVSEPL